MTCGGGCCADIVWPRGFEPSLAFPRPPHRSLIVRNILPAPGLRVLGKLKTRRLSTTAGPLRHALAFVHSRMAIGKPPTPAKGFDRGQLVLICSRTGNL